MSKTWLPDTPAYVQLRPSEPKWGEAGGSEKDFLTENLGVFGEIQSVQYVREFPFGRYRILDHEPPLYIKILPANRFLLQQQSRKVADWLNDHRLLCPDEISRYSTIVDERYLVLTYEYFDGRFAEYSTKDIEKLGKSIGKLHQLLRQCPWRVEVEKNGNHRLQILKNTLSDFKERGCCNSIPEYVTKLLSTIEESMIDNLKEGQLQVVHGDLNYGNMIFSTQNGPPMLCDFEDTMTAWFAAEMENAFVIERFILAPTDEQSILLAKAYYSAYTQSGESFFKYPEQLEQLLKALAVRALLILLLKESEYPHSVQESEWQKFVYLYCQADKRSGLLGEISKLH
jgi:thiamine kinase-like enzyme